MQDLLIFPFNGNGLEALGCLGGNFKFVGFVDDTESKQGMHSEGFTVFNRSAFEKYSNALVLAVPGSPTSFKQRDAVINNLNMPSKRFATVIHERASISPMAKVGRNVLLMAGVVITSNAIIGDHVCVLPNTVIHHDSTIGDYSLIGSNVTIAGNSKIGKACYVGSGTSIINGIEIADGCLIGIGSNVIRTIGKMSKVVGNPAREIE